MQSGNQGSAARWEITEAPRSTVSMSHVAAIAILVGVVVAMLGAMINSSSGGTPTYQELEAQIAENTSALKEGREAKNLYSDDGPSWFIQNWWLSGLIATAVVLVLGRLYVFMIRLENRPRT